MNGLCNLVIPLLPLLYNPQNDLKHFFAAIVKSLLSVLMYKVQVVSLHDVLKQNTGAYWSAHNLLIPSLNKSVLPSPSAKLFPPGSQHQCLLSPWVVVVFLPVPCCLMYHNIQVSPKLDTAAFLAHFTCRDQELFV